VPTTDEIKGDKNPPLGTSLPGEKLLGASGVSSRRSTRSKAKRGLYLKCYVAGETAREKWEAIENIELPFR